MATHLCRTHKNTLSLTCHGANMTEYHLLEVFGSKTANKLTKGWQVCVFSDLRTSLQHNMCAYPALSSPSTQIADSTTSGRAPTTKKK